MFERYNFEKVEKSVKERWEKDNIYSKTKEKFSKYPKFYFLDGPPYATGFIHMGTAWNKILKDAYIRFMRMKGRNVFDRPGYDTHGTPIEVKVEKELGFESKKDIEKFGVDKFIEKCREFATKYIGVMNEQFKNLGVWMNFNDPYITLTKDYIEGAWYTFKVAYKKGLLYKGFYPVHVCPRCETAVAYNEIEYMKKSDPSIFVKFKLEDERDTYAVIWTTTPWTLPSNVAIMVHPDYEYSYVRVGAEVYIIARDLVNKVMKKWKMEDYEIVKVVRGEELEGKKYIHPFKDKIPPLRNLKKGHFIITNPRYVTLEEGTGLVHVAPGHGKEDYKAALPYGLDIISPLNLDGTYKDFMGPLRGMFAYDSNDVVMRWLEDSSSLIYKEKITHDYPKCWRCSTPLILMAVDQWFFKITAIRDKLIEENENVEWHPEWAKKRFKTWLENLEDWPISRQRYWGIPLPIWICNKCNNIEVFGSIKEIEERTGKKLEDLHRPYIDEIEIKCEKCYSIMRRVQDVLDVWFDSGVASWSALDYPSNRKLFDDLWPCDLQIEGADQIRGWWNSQIITSVITFDKRPFNRIIFHGLVLDAKGVKMSKSKGNVITPEEAIEKYGRDALRMYLLSAPPWNNFYFSWSELDKVGKILNVYWNIYQFIKTYALLDHSTDVEDFIKKNYDKMNFEDKWIISEFERIYSIVDKEFYELHRLVNELNDFTLQKFSRSYIKMVRDRVSLNYDGDDKIYAVMTLNYVMKKLTTLYAPIIPYLTDYIHRDLYRESVHLVEYGSKNRDLINKRIIDAMNVLFNIDDIVSHLRQNNGIKARYPLQRIGIIIKDDKVISILKNEEKFIKSLLNSKEIAFAPFDGDNVVHAHEGIIEIYVDLSENEELKVERFLRELMRHIQVARKKKGKRIDEKVDVMLDINYDLKDYVGLIERETNSNIYFENLNKFDEMAQYKDLKGKILVK